MSWENILKGAFEDVKATLKANKDNGWIGWYIEIITDDLGRTIDDIPYSELKEDLKFLIEESEANASKHEHPAIDHSRSKAGGPIYYEDEVRPENKEHAQANPFFTRQLERLEKN